MNSQVSHNNILVILLVLCQWVASPRLLAGDGVVFESTMLDINGRQHELEIARTAVQRQQGLMYRENLSVQGGMLFIYSEAGFHRIWMKNTLIPLTVVWLDSHQTVIHIARLNPCQSMLCPSFGADKPAKYIIELAEGNKSLQLGDRVHALADFQAKE